MIISAIVFLIGFLGLTIIPPGKIGIIERLGTFKYSYQGPKKKFLFPLIHQVILIDLVQTIHMNRVKVKVNDDLYAIGIRVVFEVVDAKQFFYQRRKAMHIIKSDMVSHAETYFMVTKNTSDLKALEEELEPILIDASASFGFRTIEFQVTHIGI
ncbi:MAG: SPFH domain-containing protein [Acholeplasmataceae bacterium]